MEDEITLSKLEKETIICFNEAEPFAEIYTCSDVWIRKLEKLVAENADVCVEKRDKYSITVNCPKKFIKVLKPKYVSAETREKSRIRMLERIKQQGGI